MGTSDNKEITALFSGYGYQCAIVDYGDLAHHSDAADHALQVNLAATMKWAIDEIQKIQKAARSGKPITKPRWPMIFLRTPKGWTGPRFVGGLPVVNSFRARAFAIRFVTQQLAHNTILTCCRSGSPTGV
jgi:xylulose-5-phosphate/fructose-6-phosphate phosphoketolase